MRKLSFLKPGIVNFGMEQVNSILRVRRNAEFSKAKGYVVTDSPVSKRPWESSTFHVTFISFSLFSPTRKNQDYFTSNFPISDDNSSEMKKFPREFIHHVHLKCISIPPCP